MPLKLYLDENVDVSVAVGLQRRSIDVVTARDRGKLGVSNEEHLTLASSEERVMVTHDIADFVKLHREWLAAGKSHSGIAVSSVVAPGMIIKRIAALSDSLSAGATANNLIFLANFGE